MIQIDRETFQVMLHQIMERFDRIDRTLERMNKLKECLEGDTLFGQLRPLPAARRHQTHAGALSPEKIRNLLYD